MGIYKFEKSVFYKQLKLMLINDINHSPSLEVLSVLNVLSEQYENRIEWEELVYKTLLRIREEIYAGKYHPFSINSGFTHILCILDDLIIKIPDLSRFHNACFRVLKDNIRLYLDLPSDLSSNREYELITGLSGVARYLMDHTDDVESNYLLEKITDRLINRSVARDMQGGQITGYQYYPDEIEQKYMNSNIANGCVNYGVSHGMGGPLIVLSEMYERGYHNSLLLSTIHNLWKEYLDALYKVQDIVYWPGRISAKQYFTKELIDKRANQMSWCYGSVGILRGLYISAKAIGDKEKELWVQNELKKIAQMPMDKLMLSSTMVCHGFSGIALIMNLMYENTRDVVFHQTTHAIIEYILKMLPEEEKYMKQFHYLEGSVGVLQTLISLTTGIHNCNEKRLLII